ncbi:MAG: hypothetical protein PGN11_16170 [Quadrisphaera sp.]
MTASSFGSPHPSRPPAREASESTTIHGTQPLRADSATAVSASR